MKQFMRLFLCTVAATAAIGAYAQEGSAPKIKFYGFVRNYMSFDTRESVAGTEDLFYYLPKDRKLSGGEDLNQVNSFRFASLTSTSVTGYSSGQVSSPLFISDTLLIFARILFAAISCIYFAILGFNYCGIIYDVSQFKLLALGPLAWVIVRLITDFMWKINYRNISDLLLEMFMLAALMFFFMSFARINSNVNGENAYRKLYAFGFIGSLLALMLSVPRLVLILIGQSARVPKDFTFSMADFLIGIFIIYYLFVNIKSQNGANASQVEEIK